MYNKAKVTKNWHRITYKFAIFGAFSIFLTQMISVLNFKIRVSLPLALDFLQKTQCCFQITAYELLVELKKNIL